MRLNFNTIDIHSFMSFDDASFDFNSYDGMTLVCGKNNDIPGARNGSGKSNLMNSLLYVLFGQLQSKIKNENVVNKFVSDKDMRIVLSFDVDTNHYRVIRGSKKGKSTYLELYENDENITKSSIQETQDFLENEILHCDITIFLRTILLSADQNYNFYMLKKADKKDFVEKLFDISVFGDIYNAIHKDILAYDKQIIAKQNRLSVLSRNKDEYNTHIKTYESNKSKQLVALNESMQTLTKTLDDLNKNETSVNDEEVTKVKTAQKKLETAIETLNESLQTNKNSQSKIDVAIQTLGSSKTTKQSIIEKHSTVMNKLCDDCKIVFSDYYKIGQYQSEINDIDTKIVKLNEKLDTLKHEQQDTRDKIDTLKTKSLACDDKLRLLTEQANKTMREIANVSAQLESVKSKHNALQSETNPYVTLLKKNDDDIESETKTLDEIAAKYKYLKFAENIVSQDTLRKFIIADLIALLNNKIKTYLTKLGSKYTVVFDSDMDYEFVTPGGSCEFQNFSAGERMRIMIATSFAFRDFMSIRNGLNANVLILDEYFDSAIDSSCVDSILNILHDYVNDYKQNVFVISHRSEVNNDSFSHILQIEKTDNISKIVELGK